MAHFTQQFQLEATIVPPQTFNANPGPTNIAIGQFGDGTTALQVSPPAGTPANTLVTYQVEFKRECDVTWTAMAPVQSSANPVNVTLPTAANTAIWLRVNANGGRFSPVASFSTISSGVEAPDGTNLTLPGNIIRGFDGTQYSLVMDVNAPYLVSQNGANDGFSSRVIRLVYSGHLVYQQNSDYNWWSKRFINDLWTQTASPIVGEQGSGKPVFAFSIRDNPTGTVMSPNGAGDSSSACQVTYIFVGDEWNTLSNPSASDILSAMNSVYLGPYFSGMQEYGVFGKPTVVSSFLLLGSPPDFSTADTQSYLQTTIANLFDTNVLPIPTIDNHLIMLIMPPSANSPPGVGGFHNFISYHDLSYGAGMVFYLANGGPVTLNQFTIGLTHETAEHMTNGRQVPQNWFGPGDGSTAANLNFVEIADFSNQTQFVLNGVTVEGFYSNRQRAVIVPTIDTSF